MINAALEIEQIHHFSKEIPLTLSLFYEIVFLGKKVSLKKKEKERLLETREFIEYLTKNQIKVYGLSTGFGDLRKCSVSPEEAGTLSKNIILSHDAGVGESLPEEVTLGAMVVRANSLAIGNSGFKLESLQTLIDMINARIVPQIPSTGSLGASGDLAFLARLGRAMQGDEVPVSFNGSMMMAKEALERAGIRPFDPDSKEGLALTNGTSFMASMLAIGYLRELHVLENIFGMQALFLNAVNAIDAAFLPGIQTLRGQKGQTKVANILLSFIQDSPFVNQGGIQDDYSIRCLPQIFGPKIELFLSSFPIIERELNAVTDNPLIFKGEEITKEVKENWIIPHKGENWAVLSGGNFHGEYLATAADSITTANVKIALTMERQITFMMNPARNDHLFPVYLIKEEEKKGLNSGFMITQYTANALTHKICLLGTPCSIYNVTSANEAEDVVSYGATAGERLLNQLNLFHQLNALYLTVVTQAYSISRDAKKNQLTEALLSEKILNAIQNSCGPNAFPILSECPFDEHYKKTGSFLCQYTLRELIDFPLVNELGIHVRKNELKNPLIMKPVF